MQGILCFLAERQLQKFRLGEGVRREMPGGHFRAGRPTLIEIVDDVTGAGEAPVRGGVNRKGRMKRLSAQR